MRQGQNRREEWRNNFYLQSSDEGLKLGQHKAFSVLSVDIFMDSI